MAKWQTFKKVHKSQEVYKESKIAVNLDAVECFQDLGRGELFISFHHDSITVEGDFDSLYQRMVSNVD